MRRLAFALLFGALGAAAFGQEASPKVTFTMRAARAERVLAELGKAANLTLTTSPQTADEVMVISATDVPLSDLLAKIATAASAEWRQEEGGYRLVPATGMRTREEQEALNARIAAIRKSINDVLAKKKPSKPAGKDAAGKAGADEEDSFPGTVGDTTVYEIAARTDLAAIAALANGERVVFSTQPTRMQRRFSGDITGLINTFIAEHNKQVANNGDPTNDPEMEKLPSFIREMAGRMSKPIGQVSKALFVVSRMGLGMFGMTQAELRLYDPSGKVSFTVPANIRMPGSGIEAMMETLAITPKDPKEKPATVTPVELSPDSKAFMETFSSGGMGALRGLKMTTDIRTKIYRPDQYDPLSYLPTDEVLALAKKQNRPVVAVLPDDAVSLVTNMMPSQKPTVEQFEKRLAGAGESRIVSDAAWLIIKPVRPAEARANRLDRAALTRLLGAALEKGVVSLDDVAAYSLKAPSPLEGGLGSLYVMFLVPGAFSQSMSGFTNWEALRFYGSLDVGARQNLAQGGRIPFSVLTSYQQEQVRKMAFGSMPALEVDEPGKKDDGMPMFMRAFMGGGGGDYRTEPTELLPNGLTGNGFVELKLSNEPFASAVTPEGTQASATMAVLDSEMLAMFKMLKEDTNMAAMAGMLPTPDRVRIGQKRVLTFNFRVAPTVSMHQTLNDHQIPKDAQVTAFANLPADFQRLIAEKQAALKKSPLGAMLGVAGMGMGGGVIKP
jgi:hypothetical protein